MVLYMCCAERNLFSLFLAIALRTILITTGGMPSTSFSTGAGGFLIDVFE